MDENSCMDETSQSVENAVKGQKTNNSKNTLKLEKVGIVVGGKASQNKIFNRCGSSHDASGPSTGILTSRISKSESSEEFKSVDKSVEPSAPSEENEPIAADSPKTVEERALEEPSAPVQENCNGSLILPSYEDGQNVQSRVRIETCLNEQATKKKLTIGPPPSYSFVMKQKKKVKLLPSSNSSVINRTPPPNYANTRGLFLTSQESRVERFCNFPSFVEPVWRAHSQPALCPRCGIVVITIVHSHDSLATHLAALVLCLFGCWPCCLLPYCINVCKNTYHYCPICQSYLGLYTPCALLASEIFRKEQAKFSRILENIRTLQQIRRQYLENHLNSFPI